MSALYEESKKQVNAWLKKRGLPYPIEELCDSPTSHPECGPALLELFKTETSLYPGVRFLIADAMFYRKLDTSQKREAVRLFLDFVKKHPGAGWLQIIIMNSFEKNAHPDNAREIGEMTLDLRYIGLWGELMDVLRHIGTPEAISYILKATKGPSTAAWALNCLARLRYPNTLALCEEALNQKDVQGKDAIKETYSKLKRQLAKKQGTPKHVTTDEIPKTLTEWSANLDAPQLPKALRCIKKCCETGFAKDEISEVRSVADDLSPEQTARFKFEVTFNGKKTILWIEVFCDDEDAHDLYLFGDPALMSQIEKDLDKVIQ